MLGENIKKLRKYRGLTQTELAEKLHISDKTISSWEINRTEPNVELLEKLSIALNCEKSDILDGKIKKERELSSDDLEVLDLYSQLDNSDKEAAKNMLRGILAGDKYKKASYQSDKVS